MRMIRRIKLMNSLLLSRPAPDLYYGDEIAIGDNFFIGDRNGVRTPMPMEPGFAMPASRAQIRSDCTCRPFMDAVYGYQSNARRSRATPARC